MSLSQTNELIELVNGTMGDSLRYFRRGRHSLAFGFKSLGLQAGDTVLMPEYICRDLLSSFYVMGIRPKYYPISSDLKPATPISEWPIAKAVLAVNYFGFPQDLKIFREYCDKYSAVLIEDNAHGFLSQDSEGMNLGLRGDIGIFSFGKTVMLACGSAVFFSKKLGIENQSKQIDFLKTKKNIFLKIKHCIHIFPVVGIIASNSIVNVVRKIRKITTGSEVEVSTIHSEKVLPTHPNPPNGLLQVLNSVDIPKERERRRQEYLNYSKVIKDFGADPIFPVLAEKVVPYGFPFIASDNVAMKISSLAKSKSGFDVFRWPELPSEIQEQGNTLYKKIWIVNFLW